MDDTKDEPLATAVVAFRLTSLESDVKAIDRKLDHFGNNYPSKEMLELILKPLYEDVRKISNNQKEEAANKKSQSTQIKMITYAAILTPFMSIVVSALVAFIVMGARIK